MEQTETHIHTKTTPLPFEKVDGNKTEREIKKNVLLTFQEVPCMGSLIALLQTQML